MTEAGNYLQILEANFQMQLTSTGNDVLTCLLNRTLDHGIRLRQAFQTCHRNTLHCLQML